MKVLVTDPLADEAMKILQEHHDVTFTNVTGNELAAIIAPYHALMIRSGTKVTKEIIARADNLRVIGRAGIGVDNIDIQAASDRGIKVVNSPTGATPSVAELAIGHMISMARHLSKADRSIRSGEWAKKQLKGTELNGKTLGLVGCGNIGQMVARIAQVFNMQVIGYDPFICKEDMAKDNIIKVDTLETLFQQADFISLHIPHIAQTHHIIDASVLKVMKPTAYLVNCARGGVVDEDALYMALKNGELAGAALDVYEQEPPGRIKLMELENVVFTPHLGAATKEGQIRAGTVCAEQVIKVLCDDEPDFWVNRL